MRMFGFTYCLLDARALLELPIKMVDSILDMDISFPLMVGQFCYLLLQIQKLKMNWSLSLTGFHLKTEHKPQPL